MNSKEADRQCVYDEMTNALEKLSLEYYISPAFSCIHASAYCVSSIIALYKSEGKKIPKDLVTFITKTYPKMLKDFDNTIQLQYLAMNTEGSA